MTFKDPDPLLDAIANLRKYHARYGATDPKAVLSWATPVLVAFREELSGPLADTDFADGMEAVIDDVTYELEYLIDQQSKAVRPRAEWDHETGDSQ